MKRRVKMKKKGIFSEFVAFINKGNALALAIGVIIGGAFSNIVTAINKSIISPLIAAIIGEKSLAENEALWTVLKTRAAEQADVDAGLAASLGEKIPSVYISWGAFIQAVIDFLLIALILFAIIKIVTAIFNKAKAAKEKLTKKEEEMQAEPVVEEPVVENLPVEDPIDVQLLKEIRDLLKENQNHPE